MRRFRVFEYETLFGDEGCVIQEKKWWGWSNWCFYVSTKNAVRDAKKMEDMGHFVHWQVSPKIKKEALE